MSVPDPDGRSAPVQRWTDQDDGPFATGRSVSAEELRDEVNRSLGIGGRRARYGERDMSELREEMGLNDA